MFRIAFAALVSCLVCFWEAGASASPPAPRPRTQPVEVLRSLYEAHQPWRNVEISWTDKRSVLKYFDADLTRLLIEDGTCVRRTKEICRLDFDPIVGSQDFPDEGFKVEISSKTSQSTEALLDVRFQNVEVVTLRFRLRQRRGQWRIADITYPDGTTLKTILSPRKSKNPADKN